MQNDEHLMTEKEQKEFDKLKPGFNVVNESNNYNELANNRVEISRKWSTKLLKATYILNLMTIACFTIAFVSSYFKPLPDYYATTPSGKLYGPLSKIKIGK